MANKTPLQVVTSFMKAMEKMDFEEGVKYVDDDIEYINSPNTVARGASGVRQTLQPFFAPIEENEFVILRQISDGNVVFLERLDRHRVPQGWFELPVTGVYEVHEERITYWREYFDLGTIQTAITTMMGAKK